MEGCRDTRGEGGAPRMFSAKLERWLMLGLDMLRLAGGGDLGPEFAIELLKGAGFAGLGIAFAGVFVSSAW
jgi:hypothetical protein